MKGEWMDCVFLNRQKAFDTAHQRRLKKKLHFQASVTGKLSGLKLPDRDGTEGTSRKPLRDGRE